MTSGYGGIRERRTDGLNLLLHTTRLLTVDALKWYVLQYYPAFVPLSTTTVLVKYKYRVRHQPVLIYSYA
jgi:hypothetical protein